jgi:uncharacterized protein YlxW (UPF0749 family)
MKHRASQLTLAAVALLIGVLVVGQIRSQDRPTEVGSLSPQELSARIEALSAANSDLRAGLADARGQLADYRNAEAQGQSALDVSREELRRLRAWSSLDPVDGQGIVVVVTGSLDEIAVNDLINELRNAGAEALAIDGVRITAHSVAAHGTTSLEIDGAPIGRSFRLSAIGDPDGLLAALERPGGLISQLELFVQATLAVTEVDDLHLPGTTVDLTPVIGSAS